MNYSDSVLSVRVDFFNKESEKWFSTEAITWADEGYVNEDIHYAFARSLERHLTNGHGHLQHSDMVAVCLHPYHEHSHPLMMFVSDIPKILASEMREILGRK